MSVPASLYRVRVGGAVILWAIVAGGGLVAMNSRAARPGESGDPPSQWPANSDLPFHSGVSNLAMFLHPMCPCSRASMDSLEHLLTRCGDRIHATVVLVQPEDAEFTIADSPLVGHLSNLPGVSVRVDRGARQTELFDAHTSGHVVLYNSQGQRLFSGGITIARAHNGDNDGLTAVQSWISNGSARLSTAPVYGCPLTTSSNGEGEQP